MHSLLSEIDAAAFELFELSRSERDLVSDFWDARGPQAAAPVAVERGNDEISTFAAYAEVFRSAWKPLLGDGTVASIFISVKPPVRLNSATLGRT